MLSRYVCTNKGMGTQCFMRVVFNLDITREPPAGLSAHLLFASLPSVDLDCHPDVWKLWMDRGHKVRLHGCSQRSVDENLKFYVCERQFEAECPEH